MGVFVVLLRAIGPMTHKIMSMAQWREATEADRFRGAETYVATGHMIVAGDGTPAEATERMNRIVAACGLGKANTAVVRTPAQLRTLVKADPFPDASVERPSQMGIYFFAAARPDFSWIKDYDGPERVHVEGAHLIVDYTHQISASPKLPGLIEKRSGTCTARNWNTLRALAERATAREKNDKD